MDRTTPNPGNEEIDLYLRTYYSLLRSSGEVEVRSLEETHSGTNASLHREADSPELDLAAFVYSAMRLPLCVSDVRLVLLGQSAEVFSRRGYPNVENWQLFKAPARRRKMFFDGQETMAVFINSISDIDDLIPMLTTYQIEWNKMHMRLTLADPKQDADYSLADYQAALGVDEAAFAKLHQVWGEVTCLQIDTADLEDLRVGGDLFITPVSEKTLLTPTEKVELLGKLKAKPSFELIGSASLIGIDGGQGLMQMVEEIRYPCEHHEVIVQDRRSGTSHYLPGGYETREAGIRLNWTSNALPDKSVIGIVLLSEASFLGGWFDLGSGLADQPLIISWDQTTCFYLRDGMTLVMTGVPTTAFGKSVALTPNAIPDTMGAKTAVVLVSARILRMPEADDETDQEAEE